MQSFVNSIFITVKQIVAMLNTKQTQKTNKHSSSCLRTGINARFDFFFYFKYPYTISWCGKNKQTARSTEEKNVHMITFEPYRYLFIILLFQNKFPTESLKLVPYWEDLKKKTYTDQTRPLSKKG